MGYQADQGLAGSPRARSVPGALMLTGLGALAGATVGIGLSGFGVTWAPVIGMPLGALAASLLTFHPHRGTRLGPRPRRIARMLVATTATLVGASAVTIHPVTVATAMWGMAASTLFVLLATE